MRKTRIFHINGKELELPIYKKGDRVKTKNDSVDATGTVESTRDNGLFIDVIWDKEFFLTKDGKHAELGKSRLVDGLELIIN